MADVASILDSVANLAWPLIVVFILSRFTPGIRDLIASAKSRRFTVKIGGQELTMDEVSVQQSALIADLQTQVVALREAIGPGERTSPAASAVRSAVPTSGNAVLWVDDNPKNNSVLIETLTSRGVDVDRAFTTAQALALLEGKGFSLIVSDIGRKEENGYNRRAGLDLLAAVRGSDAQVPFVVFTSPRGVSEHHATAMAAGATLVTSSPTDVAEFIRRRMREP